MEMVMVRLVREFVARGFAGQPDDHQPAAVNQELERPVDGRDADLRFELLGGCQNFVSAEWTIGITEDLANRTPLGCIALDHKVSPFIECGVSLSISIQYLFRFGVSSD